MRDQSRQIADINGHYSYSHPYAPSAAEIISYEEYEQASDIRRYGFGVTHNSEVFMWFHVVISLIFNFMKSLI